MKREIMQKIGLLAVFFLALTAFTMQTPGTGHTEEYAVTVDASPKIINLASIRYGDIRFLTRFRYATYIADGDAVYIYFNEGEESVQNIIKTRDSLGNLILKFDLVDLLALGDVLVPDTDNDVTVVIVMDNGDEYIGGDQVFLTDKKSK